MVVSTFIGLGTLAHAAYTCPQAQEYTDAFNVGGTNYNGITISAIYEDVGGTGIQHDTNPPKRGEGVLLRVNSAKAYPNNSATLAIPDVTLEHYELYTFTYSSPVQFSGDITVYDVDKLTSERYYDAVAMWYEDTNGTLHPLTAVSYGDSGSLLEFNTNIAQQPSSVLLNVSKGYSVESSTHGGSSDPKGLVNYGPLNGISVKKLYLAYWNNYDGTKNPSGFQGVRFCAPLPANQGGNGGATTPAITLYKYVTAIDDVNGNGRTDTGDVVHYGFKVVNSGNVDLENVMIADTITSVQGGPLVQLAVGSEDNTTFSAEYTITNADVARGGVENRAIVTAQDSNGVDVTDISDTLTDPDGNQVNNPDTTETPNPFNINTNDTNDPTDDPTTVYTSPIPAAGSIEGRVDVKDDNGNLKGLPGVVIVLYDANGHEVSRTTTGQNGSYMFANLTPGAYRIVEIQPNGYVDVSEDEGGEDDDATAPAVNTLSAIVNPGEKDKGNNFVERKNSGKITGTVKAVDNNGKYSPIPNVTLVLYNEQGQEVARTKTDAAGNYSFTAPPGNYYIQEQQPTDYYSVSEDEGGADDDAVHSLLNTISVKLGVSEVDIKNDFVEKKVDPYTCSVCAPKICNSCAAKAVTFTSDGTAVVTWKPTDNSVNYEIYLNGKFVASVDKDTREYRLKNLTSDTQYTVKVVAVGKKGGTLPQTFTFKTPSVGTAWMPALYYIMLP